MSSDMLETLLRQARSLSPSERLFLAGRLIESVRPVLKKKRLMWAHLKGQLTYPAVGMDAQDWVCQMREESDQQRSMMMRQQV
ncbi:MAG: hypothetical protein N2117_11415 [Anaerolineales bacterium]|nr:hypothetical protein [Anaerolineales bacterium]